MSFYPHNSANRDFPAIRIDGGAAYETEVARILRHIHVDSHSRVGAMVVSRILLNPDRREGLIIRDPHHDPHRPLHNAITNPRAARMNSDQPASTPTDLLRHPGRGAGATISYYPTEWPAIGMGAPCTSRDEVLLHELVHVYMIQRGLSSVRRLNNLLHAARLRNFDIVDDFFAIMITNVYASERSRRPRLDHHGDAALNRNAISIASDPQFRPFFAALDRAAPDISGELRSIYTPFNPWRPQIGLVDATSAFNDP